MPFRAQRTQRFSRSLEVLGFALGGCAAARVAARLGLRTSRSTLLRCVQHAALPARPTPRVLGVDDVAFRKGHLKVIGTGLSYGVVKSWKRSVIREDISSQPTLTPEATTTIAPTVTQLHRRQFRCQAHTVTVSMQYCLRLGTVSTFGVIA